MVPSSTMGSFARGGGGGSGTGRAGGGAGRAGGRSAHQCRGDGSLLDHVVAAADEQQNNE